MSNAHIRPFPDPMYIPVSAMIKILERVQSDGHGDAILAVGNVNGSALECRPIVSMCIAGNEGQEDISQKTCVLFVDVDAVENMEAEMAKAGMTMG